MPPPPKKNPDGEEQDTAPLARPSRLFPAAGWKSERERWGRWKRRKKEREVGKAVEEFKKKRKGKGFFLLVKRENGPECLFLAFFPSCFSSPTMRLPKRFSVLIEGLTNTFNTRVTKTHLCADVIHLVKRQPKFASPPWCCSQLFYFTPSTASFSGNLSLCLPLPLALSFCLSCSLFAVGRQAGRADRSFYRQGGNACPLKWNWGPVELSDAWLAWSIEEKERETKQVKCRVRARTEDIQLAGRNNKERGGKSNSVMSLSDMHSDLLCW